MTTTTEADRLAAVLYHDDGTPRRGPIDDEATARLARRRAARAARADVDRIALDILTTARRGARGATADAASDADDHVAAAALAALARGADPRAAAMLARQHRGHTARAAVARSARERAASGAPVTHREGWADGLALATARAAEGCRDTVTTAVTVVARCACGRVLDPAAVEHVLPSGRTVIRAGWAHRGKVAHDPEMVPGSARVVAIGDTVTTTDTDTARNAAYAADGPVERPDRDTARQWANTTTDAAVPLIGTLTGRPVPAVLAPYPMGRPGASGHGEITRGDRSHDGRGDVREARETTTAAMLDKWATLGAAGNDHGRPDETDRYGARRFWRLFSNATAEDRTPGKYAAAIRAAVDTRNAVDAYAADRDGRPAPRPVTLADYIAAAYRTTTARGQSRPGRDGRPSAMTETAPRNRAGGWVDTAATLERGAIDWAAILSALPGVTVTENNARQYRRALVRMTRAAAVVAIADRFADGADRHTAREREAATVAGRWAVRADARPVASPVCPAVVVDVIR